MLIMCLCDRPLHLRHSSSSSSDDFEDWANDTEEGEGDDDDDDDDDGAVYDWTAMDTAGERLHATTQRHETTPTRA